ncbi:MAG: glycosyltransferase family 39 protein [Bacteroidota bacterium]
MFTKKTALLSVFLSVVIRLLFVYFDGNKITSDEIDYYSLALNIIHGKGFSLPTGFLTAYRPPAYPFFMAGILSVIPSVGAIEIVQILLEIGSGVILYHIGKRVFSQTVGFAAMMMWNLFPTSIILSSQLMSESLVTFLLLLIVMIGMISNAISPWKAFLGGCITGIVLLAKPQAVLLFTTIGIYSFFKKRGALPIRPVVLMGIGMLLIITPWIIRNKLVFGEFLVTTNGGMNFWIGNNDEANGSYFIPAFDTLSSITNEPEQNRRGYQSGFSFIREHPVRWVELAVRKTAFLFSSQNYVSRIVRENSSPHSRYLEKVRMIPIIDLALLNVPFLLMLYSEQRDFSCSTSIILILSRSICSRLSGLPSMLCILAPPVFSIPFSRFIACLPLQS